jgi:hypothetical protein
MATRKRWEDHSPSWRAKHAAAGETKARWNKYLSLSPETQKKFSVEQYAAGTAVPVQRIEGYKDSYRTTMYRELFGRKATVEKNIREMTPEQLSWAAKATAAQIQARGRSKDPKFYVNGRNVWWYK